jgi:hypothetical protein
MCDHVTSPPYLARGTCGGMNRFMESTQVGVAGSSGGSIHERLQGTREHGEGKREYSCPARPDWRCSTMASAFSRLAVGTTDGRLWGSKIPRGVRPPPYIVLIM